MKTKFLPAHKAVLCFLVLLFSLILQESYGQSESNDMITYDTSVAYVGRAGQGGGGNYWLVRITRPRNYFVAGSADTASRPVIITMPGAGEVGSSNAANAQKFGPHYWLKNGWDGSVKLGNGTHYPILITIVQSIANTRPWYTQDLLDKLIKIYHPKAGAIHMAGLSQGVWVLGEALKYRQSAGDDFMMSRVNSFVDFQGVCPSDKYGVEDDFPAPFGYWAKTYGGKFFCLEGTNDSRKGYMISENMNSAVANSAYFSYETIGGGTHCCWNSMYDPSVTDWTLANGNLTNNTYHPFTKGTYTAPSNVFQWMLRQGDTTLVGQSSGSTAEPPVVAAGSDQSIQLPTSSVTLTGTASANGSNTISTISWTKTSGPSSYSFSDAGALKTTVSGLVAGTYVFTLTVTDNKGQQSTASVTITVKDAALPVVSAGSAISITLPANQATLTGTASGQNGASVASTTWSQVSGPGTAVIASATSLTTSVSGLVEGSYVFQLLVKDSYGTTNTAQVTVTVNPAVTSSPNTSEPAGHKLVGQGEYQVFYIDEDGYLYGSGGNLRNLGVNNSGTAGLTMRVAVSPSDLKFKSVAGGLHGGGAVDVNGYAWTFGDNGQGQLGVGNTTTTYAAMKIETDSLGNPFTNVESLTYYFSANANEGCYAIKSDGTLWIWGATYNGMRGDGFSGTINTRPVQIAVPGGRKAKQIVAGNEAILLCTDGTVWTTGGNGGNPQNLGYAATGDDYLTWHQLAVSDIEQVAGGLSFNYALKSDGTLYGWGFYGSYMGYYAATGSGTRLATPTPLTNITGNLPATIKTIVTNTVCTHVILTDGSLWGWGDNAQGTIGNGKELDYSKTTNPYSWDFLPGTLLQQLPERIVSSRSDFIDVFGSSVFTFYTYAVAKDGTMYSWGRNKGTILGNGVMSCSPNVTATYPNAWDVPEATVVDPFSLKETVIVPCPICVIDPSISPCSDCSNVVAPVSKAGDDLEITLPVNSVKLDGSTSYDPGGSTLTYSWQKIAGPDVYTIASSTSAATDITGLEEGIYQFQLTVTNKNGTLARDVVQVIVKASDNTAPTANAGSDITITLPTNTVTLKGTGTDSDGTISAYSWKKTSGPATYTIASASAATTAVNNLVEGVYEFELTVTDDDGATATDVVTVTVKAAANVAPTANAGSDKTIQLPSNSLTLTGSGTDSDGSIVSYSWTKVSGPTAYTIVSNTSPSTIIKDLVAGVYDFQLTVTDDDGATATDVVRVTVTAAANVAPTANAGTDISITLPVNTVNLSGSGADDDGTIASYSWTKVSGPATYTIASATSAGTSVKNLVEGTYEFQLTVTDDDGATATDVIKVTVKPAVNVAPAANAGTDITITLPTNSTTLTGSGTDSDGSIAAYSWTRVSGPATFTIVSATSASTSINGLVEGTYEFQLTVTDDDGATATDVVKVIVNPKPNVAPTANAGSDITITMPTNSTTLSGSGTDSDGSIVSYTWTQTIGSSATIVSTTSAATDITGLTPGVYEFRLTVTDEDGATGSDLVKVTVNAASNKTPSANAGSDKTIVLPSSSLTLAGSGTDSDGSIVSYSWAKTSGPSSYNIISAASASTDVNNLVQGTYEFQLTVTDDGGASASDVVKVIVQPKPNVAPVANAGTDITITLPINSATLSGAGTDSDGSIAGYSWAKVSGPSSYSIVSATSAATDVKSLVEGTYEFQLTVTDDDGATATDIIKVIVQPAPNVAPSVNAGTDITITLPTNSTTLSGAGNDSDGSIAGYSWTKISGPASYSIVSATSAATDVKSLVEGTYEFQLTVTDNDGATATDIVKVIVQPKPNVAPVANAGSDITITLPTSSATLSGSGTDSDGNIASYKWTKISGPSSYSIVSATSAATDVKSLVEGTYEFQLTVTDDDGATATDIVKVIVKPAPNVAPVANAGTDITITLPTSSATLKGAGTDSDGSIASYKWTKVSGPSSYSIVSATSASTDVKSLVEGTYEFQLTVTDDDGATATDIVKVIVKPAPNVAPVANAGTDITITLPTSSATLKGSGTDSDGSIASYKWTKVSGPSSYSIVSATSASTDVKSLVEGTYEFQLTVTDDDGATATDIVKVIVKPAANVAPTANAGSDIIITLPTSSATLKGTGTDSDGSIASYKWTKVSGPSSYSIVSATSASTDVKSLVEGTYEFQLTVTDDDGATATDIVKVTVVLAANQLPVAVAGDDFSVKLPVSNGIKLDGTASYDPDGSIVSYSWTKISGPDPFTAVNVNSAVATLADVTAGVFVFELTVVDDRGGKATDRITVTVEAANQAPVAITGGDTTVAFPTSAVMLDGEASTDLDGTVVAYRWRQVAGPGVSTILNAEGARTEVKNLAIGKYEFELTVTDNEGATNTTTVSVEVQNLFSYREAVVIYPNPVGDVLNYMIFSDHQAKAAILILDAKGNILKKLEPQITSNAFTGNINVATFKPGVYFFLFQYQDGVRKTVKFVKR